MHGNGASAARHGVETASGCISYTEQGAGPVALFVHGVLLNGHLWRQQPSQLSDTRRCIAVDLLPHGETALAPGHDGPVPPNALLPGSFLAALRIDQVHPVRAYRGRGFAQGYPARA